MKRHLPPVLICLGILLLSAFNLFAKAPWPGVEYSEVRAYAWPNDKDTRAVILPGIKLKPGAINQDGAVITADQTKRLLAAVTGNYPEHAVANCYIPHNAFVFYDAEKMPVAYVEVCFTCLSTVIKPGGSAEWPDLVSLATIFDELKLPMGDYADLKAFKAHFQSAPAIKSAAPETKQAVPEAAPGGPLDGVWVNVDEATRSIPKIEISGTQFVWWGVTHMLEQGGKTHRQDASYGPMKLTLLGDSVGDKSPNKSGYVTEDSNFADRHYVLRRVGEQLVVESLTIFKDGSGRANYHETLTFKKQTALLDDRGEAE